MVVQPQYAQLETGASRSGVRAAHDVEHVLPGLGQAAACPLARSISHRAVGEASLVDWRDQIRRRMEVPGDSGTARAEGGCALVASAYRTIAQDDCMHEQGRTPRSRRRARSGGGS